MSVPVSEGPLYANQQTTFSPISPTNGLQFFDQFTDHAAKSNAEKRQVLDELLLHQDDPLYWVNDTNEHTLPDPDVPKTEPQLPRLSQSPEPSIFEEPSLSGSQGGVRVSDRYVNLPFVNAAV